MPRIWLTCALATAVVVVAVILVTNRPEAEANGDGPPKPPPPLTEQEVRTYIEIMPQIRQMFGDLAMEFQRERVANDGKADETAFQIKSQAQVDALLESRHLTRETWDKVRKRVEYAVDAVRAVPQLLEARPQIEEKIALKKALLAKLARADERAMIEKEIKDLEGLLEGKGPPLLDQDRDLVGQYWRALDEAVPQRGPGPR